MEGPRRSVKQRKPMTLPTKRSDTPRKQQRGADGSNEADGFAETQVEERRTGEGSDSALARLKIIQHERERSGV